MMGTIWTWYAIVFTLSMTIAVNHFLSRLEDRVARLEQALKCKK